jgi:hypothetical protein
MLSQKNIIFRAESSEKFDHLATVAGKPHVQNIFISHKLNFICTKICLLMRAVKGKK